MDVTSYRMKENNQFVAYLRQDTQIIRLKPDQEKKQIQERGKNPTRSYKLKKLYNPSSTVRVNNSEADQQPYKPQQPQQPYQQQQPQQPHQQINHNYQQPQQPYQQINHNYQQPQQPYQQQQPQQPYQQINHNYQQPQQPYQQQQTQQPYQQINHNYQKSSQIEKIFSFGDKIFLMKTEMIQVYQVKENNGNHLQFDLIVEDDSIFKKGYQCEFYQIFNDILVIDYNDRRSHGIYLMNYSKKGLKNQFVDNAHEDRMDAANIVYDLEQLLTLSGKILKVWQFKYDSIEFYKKKQYKLGNQENYVIKTMNLQKKEDKVHFLYFGLLYANGKSQVRISELNSHYNTLTNYYH